ncbi:hypothetical protein L6164_032391 [Bauhinia variegata]|uniref:Uncharacterized protein n=1 Tax=Bauhinia variegata TaxID=167791 RepID=A0ACB9KNK5_BAUVA|nr:hypothetical protein L6164_032391 [Bauhinia variegata]
MEFSGKVFAYWIGTEPFLYIANVHTSYGEELGKAQCVHKKQRPHVLKWFGYGGRQQLVGCTLHKTARDGAKTRDEGRLRFHFQSFGAASRTIMALWKTRLLTPEQTAQIAEDQEDRVDLLIPDNSGMSIIYSAELPIKIGHKEGWIANEVMTLHGVSVAEVLDLAGCLGKTVKVELNGRLIRVKSFRNMLISILNLLRNLDQFHAKVGGRWEICVSLSDGQFQQVSFCEFATIKGGTHVDCVTNQITTCVMNKVNKKKKDANVKAHTEESFSNSGIVDTLLTSYEDEISDGNV